VLRQQRAREHRTALRSRPPSAARGARPAQDPGATTPAHHSHAAIVPCPSFCCALLCSLCCGALGKRRCSARLCAVCLLLLHSALDVVARRAALKYAAPRCSRRWAASVPALRCWKQFMMCLEDTSTTHTTHQHTAWTKAAGSNNRGPASGNISSDRNTCAHDMPRATCRNTPIRLQGSCIAAATSTNATTTNAATTTNTTTKTPGERT